MIREMLEERVSQWEALGHPALIERFVLRNGKLYEPRRQIGRRGPPKNCYQNATNFVLAGRRRRPVPVYVEGFTVIKEVPVLPILHAWVSMTGDDAMDITLDSASHEYFGVAFTETQLTREIGKNGVYGLLDTGLHINHELIFALDPPLEAICKDVSSRKLKVNHHD